MAGVTKSLWFIGRGIIAKDIIGKSIIGEDISLIGVLLHAITKQMEATIRLERCPTRCTEMYRSVFWTRSSGALRSFTALLRQKHFEEEALC